MTSERKNISEPAEWWRAFERQAALEGVSLSEWIGECGLANLPAEIRDELPERTPAHRPPSREAE